jgi:hypothetical protein
MHKYNGACETKHATLRCRERARIIRRAFVILLLLGHYHAGNPIRQVYHGLRQLMGLRPLRYRGLRFLGSHVQSGAQTVPFELLLGYNHVRAHRSGGHGRQRIVREPCDCCIDLFYRHQAS